MNYTEGQFFLFLGYLLRDHAELVSGAYKDAKTQQATGQDDEGCFTWRDLTDDEKRNQVMQRMTRRLQFMQETIEHFPVKK